jgi:hypothetical protein
MVGPIGPDTPWLFALQQLQNPPNIAGQEGQTERAEQTDEDTQFRLGTAQEAQALGREFGMTRAREVANPQALPGLTRAEEAPQEQGPNRAGRQLGPPELGQNIDLLG